MPIEIKELIIKAEVGNRQKPVRNNANLAAEDRRQIIQDCVDQVLEILKKEKER